MKINSNLTGFFSLVILIIGGGCKKEKLAIIATSPTTSITSTTCISGGIINDDGCSPITSKGIVWNTNPSPTLSINSGSTNDGTGAGSFTSSLSALTANTTYYVRAYAVNSAGTAYGNELSFTTSAGGIITNPGTGVTFDGYNYKSILLGNGQEWMAENLRTTAFANGDPIPNVAGNIEWQKLTTSARSHYNNASQYDQIYGKLYNWYAVSDPRNVCPTGWHVPNLSDWKSLIIYLDPNANGVLNFTDTAGGKMKSTDYWKSPNTAATNQSGFSGLPGGMRNYGGHFDGIETYGFWWTSQELDISEAYNCELTYNGGGSSRAPYNKKGGLSVRCIKN